MTPHIHLATGTLDYHYIDFGIYLGNNQCCSVGLAEVLKKEHITTDISLEDERLDHPYGVHSYLWLPTKDETPPSDRQRELGVPYLQTLVARGERVYIHCKNGHGRSTTFLVAYLLTRGMTPDQAFAFVQERRPSVHLSSSQEEALRRWHATPLS